MSKLRIQESFEPFAAQPISINHSTPSPPPLSPAHLLKRKQKMTLSQTYALASLARNKLGREAAKPDHNLRLLVGSANLLDFLMLELREAEQEQEAWFNHSVARAQKEEQQSHHNGHVRWADTVVEHNDLLDDEDDADSDSSDDEYNEEDFEMATMHLRSLKASPVIISSREIEDAEDSDEDMYDDDSAAPELALHRTSSHPPELIHDSDSDDDSPPTSPPQPSLSYTEKQTFDMPLFSDGKTSRVQDSFFDDGYYIPERESPMIEAF